MRRLLRVSAVLFVVSTMEAAVAQAACTTTTLRFYAFETAGGMSDWNRFAFEGSDHNWRGIQACTALSGNRVFRYGGAGCTDDYTTENFSGAQPSGVTGIAIPAGSTFTRLSFWHRWRFESGFDGGTLAVSFDNFFYQFVPASAIIGGSFSYNGTVGNACPPQFAAGLPIFTGVQSSFVSTTVNLDAICGGGGCGGQTLWLGFVSISDCSVTDDGWFLDNVQVTTCVP